MWTFEIYLTVFIGILAAELGNLFLLKRRFGRVTSTRAPVANSATLSRYRM